MSNKGPLIVAGMHRSGTSLIARFVHQSGVDLGSELVGARESNPYGHFEDVDILDFHRSILVREFGHSMWVPGPPDTTEEDRNRATELIAARRHKRNWGWKEPRTCLFLDFWNELLPDVHFLFIVRHPFLVVDSLSRRTNSKWYQFWKHNKFLRAWMTYNQECARFRRKHCDRCMLVVLERVVCATATFNEALSEWLSFDFSPDAFRQLYDPQALTRKVKYPLLVSPSVRSASISFYERLQDEGEMSGAYKSAHRDSVGTDRL